jgi:hypothetical protein
MMHRMQRTSNGKRFSLTKDRPFRVIAIVHNGGTAHDTALVNGVLMQTRDMKKWPIALCVELEFADRLRFVDLELVLVNT